MSKQTFKAPRRSGRFRTWLVGCGGLAIGLVGLIALAPGWFARPLLVGDTAGGADAIVVVGGSVVPPCSADPVSRALVARAARLYRDGRARLVVFAGGRADVESCAGAPVMADLAVRSGVPAEEVRVETTATSTRESATRSDAVLLTLGVGRVLLVTPSLQMRRAEASFERVGYEIERASVPEADAMRGRFATVRAIVGGYLAWATDTWRGRHRAVPANRAHVSPPAPDRSGAPVAQTSGAGANAEGPIVLFGTSYAASWDLDRIGAIPIVNKGHAGDTTAQLLARFDRDVLAIRPRAVILWGFDNDLFDPPGGSMPRAMRDIQENILAMVGLAASQGIEPILATEVTMRRPPGFREALAASVYSLLGRTSYQDRINEQVLDGNVWLRELGRRRQLLLLDLQPMLSDRFQHRFPQFARPDGIHITPAGYAVLSEYAHRTLGAHFGQSGRATPG